MTTPATPRVSIPFGVMEIDENGIELEVPGKATTLDLTNDTRGRILFIGPDLQNSKLVNAEVAKTPGSFPLRYRETWSGINGWNGNTISFFSAKAEPGKTVKLRWAFI